MGNRNNVLIVDRDRHVRRLLGRVAQGAGLRAMPLAEVALAIDVAAERRPDAIVLDLDLADPAERDILKNVKADPRTRDIPVFLHTAKRNPPDRIAALELGAEDYFEKPHDLGQIVRRILRHLDHPRAIDAPAYVDSSAIDRPAAVLVVDDDEEIREVLRGVLEQEGYLTILTSDGEEALACLREGSIRIGLVLLDLLMPKMDGWEFQRRRQREPQIEAIPLVVLTAHGETLRGGVPARMRVPVMAKPIDFNCLLQVVARYCA